MLLFDLAIQENPESNNSIWGSEAYYLVEEGEHCWGDVAHSIGRIAVDKKFLDSEPNPIALEMDSAQELAGFEATSWAYNMRCRASRARSLGWKPGGPSLEEELPGIVEEEYKRLHGWFSGLKDTNFPSVFSKFVLLVEESLQSAFNLGNIRANGTHIAHKNSEFWV